MQSKDKLEFFGSWLFYFVFFSCLVGDKQEQLLFLRSENEYTLEKWINSENNVSREIKIDTHA